MSETWVLTRSSKDKQLGDMLVIGCYTWRGDDGSYPGDASFRAECASNGATNIRPNGLRGLIADLPDGGWVQLRYAGEPDRILMAAKSES